QVHKAVTLDGDEVVVKVQRPRIRELIETDIYILNYLARLALKYIPESHLYDPMGMAGEFSRVIEKEMDFTLEASYTERFRRNFSKDPRILIPGVYWELTTRRVLTLERVGGIKVDRIERLKEEGIDVEKIALLIAEAFFRQVFEFGLFHGDLHSGNIFVLGPEKVAFVDFGIVGRVDREMVGNLADILIGLIEEDYERLMRVYQRMGILGEDIDIPAFISEYQDLLLHYFGKPWKMAKLGELLMEYIKLTTRYKVKLPREFLLLDKCIFELEGLGRLLYPEADILKEGHRFAIELMKKEVSPATAVRETIDTVRDYQEFGRNFPKQMGQILNKMISDKFTIDFMHKGLEDFIGEVDRSSNRITFGLIVSALIVGSSLVIAFGGGPSIFGLSALGIAGFTVAGFLGIWLAFLILRSGKF
ncbi:MAG: AarF/ABC1/UbiB kinase family protein, partial [Deltaproteobacteria bacterium]|nr:AarF/ABC1/UbiB kinase family protein [Deltaproteobacteria bacterium]